MTIFHDIRDLAITAFSLFALFHMVKDELRVRRYNQPPKPKK
jgi:hypothetical protein